MNKAIAILFALSCFATSYISAKLLGVGMWFWVIVAAGTFVAISQFLTSLQGFGTAVAGSLSVISMLAILLILLAATVGGSFRLDNKESFLLFSFLLISVFGFTLVRINKKSK